MLVCSLPYLEMCKLCIQDLELFYMQPSCCRGFTAAKIFPNPKLEKEKKNFYTRFKKAIRLHFTRVSSC